MTSMIRQKPAHNGLSAQPIGDWVYAVVRHDDKVMSVEPTRHKAIGVIACWRNNQTYRVVSMRVGEVRMQDWSRVFKA